MQRLNDLFNQEDILHALKTGVMIIDHNYNVIFCNVSNADILGFPSREIEQKHCYEISHRSIRPCNGAHHICPFDSVFEKNEPLTVVHKHHDSLGHKKYVEIHAYPIKDISNKETYMVEITRDITEEIAMNISKEIVGKMLKSIQKEAAITDKTISQVGRELSLKMSASTISEYFEQFFLLGMGRLAVERTDEQRNSLIISGNNLVESVGSSDIPTCNYTLGFLCESVSKLLHGAEVSGVEVMCSSMGDKSCRFVLKPSVKADFSSLNNQEENEDFIITKRER
jgi:PAS domain S-box-containing protein